MPRNRTRFTPEAVAQILSLVAQGVSSAEIASHVGCTLGTLRVRCSQLGISLRHNRMNGGPDSRKQNVCTMDSRGNGRIDETEPVNHAHGQSEPLARLTISLSSMIVEQLRHRAAAYGISDVMLAARLVQAIARDNLFEAVLDDR